MSADTAKMILDIGGSVYAKTSIEAEHLCIIAGGGFSGLTNDGNPLNAMHYHTIMYADRGHVFYENDPNLKFVTILYDGGLLYECSLRNNFVKRLSGTYFIRYPK
jgi:hypothetical protein